MDGVALGWGRPVPARSGIGHRLSADGTTLYRCRAMARLRLQSGAVAFASGLRHHDLETQAASRRLVSARPGSCLSPFYQQLRLIRLRLGWWPLPRSPPPHPAITVPGASTLFWRSEIALVVLSPGRSVDLL